MGRKGYREFNIVTTFRRLEYVVSSEQCGQVDLDRDLHLPRPLYNFFPRSNFKLILIWQDEDV